MLIKLWLVLIVEARVWNLGYVWNTSEESNIWIMIIVRHVTCLTYFYGLLYEKTCHLIVESLDEFNILSCGCDLGFVTKPGKEVEL